MKLVEKPNLPEKLKTVVIGEKYAEMLLKPLEELGIQPLFLPNNPFIDPRLSSHADLSILHGGGSVLWLAPYLRGTGFSDQILSMGFIPDYPEITQSVVYPGDAQLNVCICGKNVICNKAVVPECIVSSLTDLSRNVVNCRQGYAKCSICVVDENSVITADRGVAAVARSAGFDVLLIEPGIFALDGFAYGFIGGAAFKISDSKLAFTGHLDSHPDKNRILHFLKKRDIEAVYLTSQPAFDIGSGITIIDE